MESWQLLILILAACCSFMLASGQPDCPDGAETLLIQEGQPVILDFGFRAFPFVSKYTKDGMVFRSDGLRTVSKLGRISI